MPQRIPLLASVFACLLCGSGILRGEQPRRFAVLIGVNRYEHPSLNEPPLKYAENDATDLAAVLGAAGYQTVLLTGAASDGGLKPTGENIGRQIHGVLQRCRHGDTVVVAFSGHGVQFDGQDDSYFCPADARPFKNRTETLVSLGGVYRQLEESFATTKVLLVDACRNDPDPRKGTRGAGPDNTPAAPRGVAVLFACSARQQAREHDSLKHGVFFHYVLEGLRGAACDRDGEVTFGNLAAYANKRVSRKVGELFGPEARQSPNVKADLADEPVLVPLLDDSRSPEHRALIADVRSHGGRVVFDETLPGRPVVRVLFIFEDRCSFCPNLPDPMSCPAEPKPLLPLLNRMTLFRRLQVVGLGHRGETAPENARALARIPTLQAVSLDEMSGNEESLSALVSLPYLAELRLRDLTARGVELLARMPSLATLEFENSLLWEPPGVAPWDSMQLPPNTELLPAFGKSFVVPRGGTVPRPPDDALTALGFLGQARQLRRLKVTRFAGRDVDIARFAKGTAVEELHLNECGLLTDAALRDLAAVKTLRALHLHGGEHFTLEGLKRLAAAPRLERLEVVSCKGLQWADATALQKLLPAVDVYFQKAAPEIAIAPTAPAAVPSAPAAPLPSPAPVDPENIYINLGGDKSRSVRDYIRDKEMMERATPAGLPIPAKP